MLYIKSYAFIKRTFVLLSPLFFVTLVSKELAFYSPSATLFPIFGNFSDDINSIRKLEAELGINNSLPEDIESYGDLMIQKTSYEEIWIEQQTPLASLRYGQDFKYEKLTEDNKSIDQIQINKVGEGEKYQIDKNSFDASKLKEKGGLSLLTVFELSLNSSDSTIPITHVAPLSDLINTSEKQYSVVKIEDKDNFWFSQPREDEYTITLKKDESQKSFSIALGKKQQISPSGSYLNGDLSSLTIKSFYILYNDDPPLDSQKYFTSPEADSDIVGDNFVNPRARKVFLSRWSNKNSKESKDPKYDFKTTNGFWTSKCEDPYKVGGFIDEDLNGKPTQKPKEPLKKENAEGSKLLEKQKKSFVNFRADVEQKPAHTQQYYWKQLDSKEQYVPSDDNSEGWTQKCQDLDSGTESKLKEYVSKEFNREPFKNRSVNQSIIPDVLSSKIGSKVQPTSVSLGEEPKYPQHKLIQSSFRAWGNVYNTDKVKGRKVKELGLHSSVFERAVKTEHKFEISIDKETWKQQLINNSKLTSFTSGKSLKQNPDISSIIEVHYPLSFSFYDPISNYLRRHKLLLKTELDLRNLYLQSNYSKEVFRFDIGRENKVIGQDYQGFDPNARSDKKKDYGLDGILSLVAGIELDLKKNLKINLTAQTNGFVNTKNPSCDLRHRLYKIDSNFTIKNSLDQKWKCSEEAGWEYRDYIHIPSFLTISLTGEPEVVSFYVDNNSGIDLETNVNQGQSQEQIKTLESFEKGLDSKEIKKVIYTTESNNGEIYFKDMASYNVRDDEFGESLQLKQGWFNTHYQYVYYYTPRKQENHIDLDNEGDLKSLKFYVSGSRNSYNSFFYSGHFNTIKTLCINNKSSTSTGNDDCADGNKYEKIEKDKKYSDLTQYDGFQTITVNLSDFSSSSSSKNLTVNFRTVLNRANAGDGKNNFDSSKSKLENLFKNDTQDPESAQAAMFSLLAVWYSLELRKEGNKLYYTTKLRPISMVSEPIKNSSSDKTSGASGSAGFEISKIELNYS